jgi:hypothetical protein
MWVDVWHPQWLWAFEQNNRPMRALRECRGLGEQASIYERGREVSIRLPLDHDAAVDDVVADTEMRYVDVEVIARSREMEHRGVSFRKVDRELVPS